MLALMYVLTMFTGVQASLLGALWPVMYLELDVALSAVGIFSWIGSGVGLASNLSAGWLLRRYGSSRVVIVCAIMTAASLLGYALSGEFFLLCLLIIPSSLGGGVVGIAMNNYVAVHYPSRHMSWVHCMWGVGSIIGPNLVAFGLRQGYSWRYAYVLVAVLWALWAAVVFILRARWKESYTPAEAERTRSMSTLGLLKIRGVKEALVTYFCYNSLEQGVMLWVSSYMVLHSGLTEEKAAEFASLFFLGITLGRMCNGFLTAKFSDDHLIRFGRVLIAAGIAVMLLPLGETAMLASLLLIGFGCAPVCPCMLHATPMRFGTTYSQMLVGVQVAAGTVGNCILPSLFGLIANHISIALFPGYLILCTAVMAVGHHRLIRVTGAKQMV